MITSLSTGRVLLAVATALSFGSAFAQSANAPSSGMSRGSEQMHHQMMGGMQKMQSMTLSGDTDKDFATMMRMHHQQAVDMARVEVEHGKSKEMKQLAQKIIKDQQKEISQIDKWLATQK